MQMEKREVKNTDPENGNKKKKPERCEAFLEPHYTNVCMDFQASVLRLIIKQTESISSYKDNKIQQQQER